MTNSSPPWGEFPHWMTNKGKPFESGLSGQCNTSQIITILFGIKSVILTSEPEIAFNFKASTGLSVGNGAGVS